MKSKRNSAEWNEPFPLDEYYAVYEWIGRWAEDTGDPSLQPIAEAADDSLRAVGLIILETMRSMNRPDPGESAASKTSIPAKPAAQS